MRCFHMRATIRWRDLKTRTIMLRKRRRFQYKRRNKPTNLRRALRRNRCQRNSPFKKIKTVGPRRKVGQRSSQRGNSMDRHEIITGVAVVAVTGAIVYSSKLLLLTGNIFGKK